MKYYAVYKGKSGAPKIFTSWDECKKEVIGYKGAIYKSFTTEKEAIDFIALNAGVKSSSKVEKNDDICDEGLCIYVDGSFMIDKGNYSFGLVAVENGEVIHKDNGKGFAKADKSRVGAVRGNNRAGRGDKSALARHTARTHGAQGPLPPDWLVYFRGCYGRGQNTALQMSCPFPFRQ